MLTEQHISLDWRIGPSLKHLASRLNILRKKISKFLPKISRFVIGKMATYLGPLYKREVFDGCHLDIGMDSLCIIHPLPPHRSPEEFIYVLTEL